MNNKIKEELNTIEIPVELSRRSQLGVAKAESEMKPRKGTWTKRAILAASILIAIGGYRVYNNHNQPIPPAADTALNKNEGVVIPPIQLPNTAKADSTADMIGVIVYNGKIYTQASFTQLNADLAKMLIDNKLGTTKNTIDEWSTQDKYAVEFASNIGLMDVYSVKGYDKDFRIMTYSEKDGKTFAEFYEATNGITVYNGKDIFGKMHLDGNIVSAQYRNYADLDRDLGDYHPVPNSSLLNNLPKLLNGTVPYTYEQIEKLLYRDKTKKDSTELTLHLKDGTTVTLEIFKEGYVHYGRLYFKINEDTFSRIWIQLLDGK